MNLKEYAQQELKRAGLFDHDADYDGQIGGAVMELIEHFADQGHSGHSAEIVRTLFKTLASHRPLTPLTGEDDEWEILDPAQAGSLVKQNRRLSSVFVNDKDEVFDLYAVRNVFPNGTTKYESRPVVFPYTPHITNVLVDENGFEVSKEEHDRLCAAQVVDRTTVVSDNHVATITTLASGDVIIADKE